MEVLNNWKYLNQKEYECYEKSVQFIDDCRVSLFWLNAAAGFRKKKLALSIEQAEKPIDLRG